MTVSSQIPTGAGAILELKGPAEEDHLLRQGRRGGLWMSVGEVIVHGAPSTYLVLTTPDVPSPKEGETLWGYKALEGQIKWEGSLPRRGVGALWDEFVKLKEREGLYGVFPGTLKLIRTLDDRSTVEGQFKLPANISPGRYSIALSILNSGKVVGQRSFELKVEMQGLAGGLTSLARRHGLLYGLAAVLLALVTGLIMGFLFKGQGAH